MRLCITAVFLVVLAWTRGDPIPTPSHDATKACKSFDHISDTSRIVGKLYFKAGFANNTYTKSLLGKTSDIWANITKTEDGFHLTEYKKMNGKCVEIEFNATVAGDEATAHILGLETHIQLRNFSKTAILLDMKASTSNIKSIIHKFKTDSHAHDASAHGASVAASASTSAHGASASAHGASVSASASAHGASVSASASAHGASASTSAHDASAHSASAHDDHAHTEDATLHIHHLFLIGRENEVTDDDLTHFREYIECTEFSAESDFHFKSDQDHCSEEESTLIH